MQLTVAIALTVLYVGISLTLGGVQPRSGVPWWFFVPATVVVLAFGILRRRREIRLIRDGETAMAVVEGRTNSGDGAEEVAYHFMTVDGTTVSGRGWDMGYTVPEESGIPVFYDAGNPKDHVVACASWFETE